MDFTPVRCLINSISRFIHLVTCRASNVMPVGKDYKDIGSLLKHLKPLLDDVTSQKSPEIEALVKECVELDLSVNEAREFLEKWSPRMSKILWVLQSKPLVLKIKISTIELSCILCRIFESSPTVSSLSNAQFCTQESRNLKIGQLSEHIEEILKHQKDGKVLDSEHIEEIIESFHLRSSEELLNECIALENVNQEAENSKIKQDPDQISQIIDLMSHIRDYMIKPGHLKPLNGIPIPSYFRCPLSLELMSDPVIVASGQTYERAAIQKWLDHGIVRCPKTGLNLSHKNLIRNYTVKALITNWCNENKCENSSSNKVPSDENSPVIPVQREDSSIRSQKVNGELSQKLYQSSPEHSYTHSRSESASSALSSIDYDLKSLSVVSGKQYSASNSMGQKIQNGTRNPSRTFSLQPESAYGELTSPSNVEKLITDLSSPSTDVQASAAGELRSLAKYNMENRVIIGQSGAIAPLISLLNSERERTQEHAVTALLNLSINENIRARIAKEGALEPLIHVLKTGNSVSKENAAAAIFSLSLIDEYRIQIGRSGAVKALVDLLLNGTIRGKKDAATALFNLSIYHDNKARIVQAGAVKYLVGFLDPETEMVDKSVALLANLSTILEGCSAIAKEGGIPSLVEILETGSQRGKENAASILLQLCINSAKYCRSVLQEGAVPPLVALSQSGTPRAKEKAQQLLSHFRNQRESAVARGNS